MRNIKSLLIGRLTAICRAVEIGMLLDGILIIHHWTFSSNEDQRFPIIQHPYLIGHEQLTSCVLIVDIAGAAAPTGNPSRPCVNGLLAQRFGDIFVCAGFIAAQIEQCVAVAGHVFPTVLEQLFELCHVLDHDVDRNFTAAAGGQDTLKVLRQRK